MSATPQEIIAALRWRYATKKFDAAQKIPAETWAALEESLVLAPSSFGLQPWKFIVVQDSAIRQQLLEKSWGQAQVTDASHFVVLTARTDVTAADVDAWVKQMAAVQSMPAESAAGFQGVVQGFVDRMSPPERHAWNTRQVYIALGQLMTAAAAISIDTCPMEGISPPDYDKILKLQGTGYATAVACALGYRAADDKYASMPKARFEKSKVIQYI